MDETLDILVILDRSGSMQDAKADHEGGLRSFVEDQRSMDGDVRFTLVQFDSHNPCEVIYDRVRLEDVRDIRLVPRGDTPLLHAFGHAVSHLRPQVPKGGRVVAMVVTDGQENCSHRLGSEWTKDRVRALVTDLEAHGWVFLFLGANIDAFADGGALGVAAAHVLSYANQPGAGTVPASYSAVASNMLRARSMTHAAATSGQQVNSGQYSALYTFTADQRAASADPFGSATFVTGTTAAGNDERDNTARPTTTAPKE